MMEEEKKFDVDDMGGAFDLNDPENGLPLIDNYLINNIDDEDESGLALGNGQ